MSTEDAEEYDTLLRAVARAPVLVHSRGGVLAGRFVLRRRLGEGSFGVVYEAEDRRDGGRVALKLLRHAEADWLYRFKREFRALQGLSHPNLVALDELFGDQERWFFTMELVDGIDFIRHARGAPAAAPSRDDARGDGQSVRTAWFHEAKLRDGLRQLFDG